MRRSSWACISSVGLRIPRLWFNSSKKVKSFQVKGEGAGSESGDWSRGRDWRVRSWGSRRDESGGDLVKEG
jgi:hypothetical protein